MVLHMIFIYQKAFGLMDQTEIRQKKLWGEKKNYISRIRTTITTMI